MSVTAPRFPDDFTVCYTEGASYWWWSPDEAQSWGLLVGNPETSDHHLETGASVTVFWTDFANDGPREDTACLLEAEDVQAMVDRVLTEAGVCHAPA